MHSLIGRDTEVAALTALLSAGPGQGVLLLGEPGIGKSALLAVAGDAARYADWQVLTAVGVESEAQMPFAGLHQVLRPLLRPLLSGAGELTGAHRKALLTAFGLAEGRRPEFFLIALAAGHLLAAAAARQPVAILIDDMQWLDPQSQEVLAFLARRAAGHRVVIVGAARTGHSGPYLTAGLTEIVVPRVAQDAADQILRDRAGVRRAADRARIRELAQGNPLALLELPAAQQATTAPVPGEEPALTERLERAFAGRYAELPQGTRDAVLLAAADPVNDLAELLAAASVLHGSPVSADALTPAGDVGLLRVADGLLHFRHPLVRSGVLQAEPLRRRHAAHAALAVVLDAQPYRRTWHRAQSIIGPDDEVADELEACVAITLGRGAVLAAIADLRRSAQLTSDSARRGHRLLMAAEHAFGLGRTDLVTELVAAAGHTELSELDWARMQWLREIFSDGVPGDAGRVMELCGVAAKSCRAGDGDLALNLLLGGALRCWWADTGPAARTRVIETVSELPQATGDPRYVATLAVAEPVLECATAMGLLSDFAARDIADGDGLRLLGMAAHAVGDTVRSADFLDRSEALLREQGRLGLLSQVLSMQVVDRLELGDWDRAAAAAEEGKRLAEETGQPIWEAGTLVCDAMNSALRGDVRQAFAYAAQVELLSSRQRLNDLLACVQLARGAALVSAGQHAAAYRELRRLFEPSDPSFHQRERYGGIAFLAEAAVNAGEDQDARQVLTEMEALATVTPAPMLHVHLRYARALLAGQGQAPSAYAELMAADLSRWPWPRARAELAYGSWLGRQGRPRDAVPPLRACAKTFAQIGAAPWAARARAELARAAARRDAR